MPPDPSYRQTTTREGCFTKVAQLGSDLFGDAGSESSTDSESEAGRLMDADLETTTGASLGTTAMAESTRAQAPIACADDGTSEEEDLCQWEYLGPYGDESSETERERHLAGITDPEERKQCVREWRAFEDQIELGYA